VIKLFFCFSLSLLFTFYIIPLLISVAFRINALDIPCGALKQHKVPTPYLGGIAIYFGFIATLALTYPFENQMFLFLVGTTLLLLVGLIDDLAPMKPHQKFLGQVIATFCFLKGGLYLKQNFFFNNYWNIPISILWILSIINAFNLVDVMDGLASLLAISAVVSFSVIAIYLKNLLVAILLMSFLGALVAFFWFNKPPARIYLGDAGSLFIGGFLAAVPFLFDWGAYNWYGYLTPIIILAIPLIEVITLIIVRFFKGIPFYQGSPDHFAIYLQANGWSKWHILLYIIFCSLILLSFSFLFFIKIFNIQGLLAFGTLFLGFWYSMLFCKYPF